MPRSIWNGTITFGLIAVPVKAHSAVKDRALHFHQVHERDGAGLEIHGDQTTSKANTTSTSKAKTTSKPKTTSGGQR
jgi:non-homologous end joining protein Ku